MDGYCATCGAAYRDGDAFCAKCGAERVDSPVAAVAPKRHAGIVTLIGVVVMVAAFGSLFLVGSGCEHVKGSMAVRGGPRAAFTFTPTGCASMQPYGHFGANLHGKGPNDGGIYVTVDPVHGDSVSVEIPGSCRNPNGTECTVLDVPRAACRAFDVDVDGSGIEVNDVQLVQGHLRLDCALGDGTTVRGRIDFGGC